MCACFFCLSLSSNDCRTRVVIWNLVTLPASMSLSSRVCIFFLVLLSFHSSALRKRTTRGVKSECRKQHVSQLRSNLVNFVRSASVPPLSASPFRNVHAVLCPSFAVGAIDSETNCNSDLTLDMCSVFDTWWHSCCRAMLAYSDMRWN